MANLFNSTVTQTDVVETAFDREVEWVLRSTPQFRAIADKRPERQAMPGDVVVFTINGDLSLATTPLSETVDPDAVARPAPSRVSVTLNEYGNAELDTIRLRKLAFTDAGSEQSITIARNMADSMDRLVRTVLDGSSAVLYVNSSNGIVDSVPTYGNASAKLFGTGVAKLRSKSVAPRAGEDYVCYVHPDVAFDLRMETGEQGWAKPHQYQDTAAIYAGEVGRFVGARFIESPRCNRTSASPDVYTSYLVGRQALAEASAIEPHVVIGPVVDKLKRFYPLGWHALLGWSLFRTEANGGTAMYLLKSTSSIEALA